MARWTALCAAAEGVGMTAAASAAKASTLLVGEPSGPGEAGVALLLVVAGGLVEGTALGLAQASGLRGVLTRTGQRRWFLLTVAVAGLGWGAASAPAALSGDDTGPGPSLPLVLAGASALGAVMGAALGAAQATALRGRVAHPWRWVGTSSLAWTPAMAVVFLGATTVPAQWSLGAVAAAGAATGLTAGAVLGLVSGRRLPALAPRT